MKTLSDMDQDQISIGDATSIVVITELPLWTHKLYLCTLNIKSSMKGNSQIINPKSIWFIKLGHWVDSLS